MGKGGDNPRFVGCVVSHFVDKYSYQGKPETRAQQLEITASHAQGLADRLPGRPVCWEHMHGKKKSGDGEWQPIGRVTKSWLDHERRLMSEFELTLDSKPRALQKLAHAALVAPKPLMQELSLRHWWNSDLPTEVSIVRKGARPGTSILATEAPQQDLWEILASALDHDAEEEGEAEENKSISSITIEMGLQHMEHDPPSPPISISASMSGADPLAALSNVQRAAISELPSSQIRADVASNIGGAVKREFAAAAAAAELPSLSPQPVGGTMDTSTDAAAAEPPTSIPPMPEDKEERLLWALKAIDSQGLTAEQKEQLAGVMVEMREQMAAQSDELEEAKEGMKRLLGATKAEKAEMHPPPLPPRDDRGRFLGGSSSSSSSQPEPTKASFDMQGEVARLVDLEFKRRSATSHQTKMQTMEQRVRDSATGKRKANAVPMRESASAHSSSSSSSTAPQQVAASAANPESIMELINGDHWGSVGGDGFEVCASESYGAVLHPRSMKDAEDGQLRAVMAKSFANHPFNRLIGHAVQRRSPINSAELFRMDRGQGSWREQLASARDSPFVVTVKSGYEADVAEVDSQYRLQAASNFRRMY
jgi:hypothetical protein